jgi:molecular chaperone DnaK (HSP70)
MVLNLPDRGMSLRRTLTREEFEQLIDPLVQRSLDRCRAALRDAGLKIEQIAEVVLVGGSTRIPFVRQRVGGLFGKRPHAELNPDEVVALGAAVQADILAGSRKGMLLLDVVPLSLGIETLGGVVDKVIHRNSTVPCRATTRYTTFVENQTAIEINVYQGERELTKDCRLLGKFKLGGIPPMPAQMAQVDVTFLVDADSLLTVSAIEKRSGQQISVVIQPGHGLTIEEVENLVLDSVEHAGEDFRTRRFIELTNKADADRRHARTAFEQAGDQLTAEQIANIEQAERSLAAALAGTDVDELNRALTAYGDATLPLAELLMNSVVNAALKGKTSKLLDADNL